jgi:hypothetical protein
MFEQKLLAPSADLDSVGMSHRTGDENEIHDQTILEISHGRRRGGVLTSLPAPINKNFENGRIFASK